MACSKDVALEGRGYCDIAASHIAGEIYVRASSACRLACVAPPSRARVAPRSQRSPYDISTLPYTFNTWKFEFPYSVLISGCEHFDVRVDLDAELV